MKWEILFWCLWIFSMPIALAWLLKGTLNDNQRRSHGLRTRRFKDE